MQLKTLKSEYSACVDLALTALIYRFSGVFNFKTYYFIIAMASQDFLHTIFRQQILGLSAYKVADARNLIKLDAMENPYHWPDEIINAWLDGLRSAEINRYPDPLATQLTATLRAINAIPDAEGVLLGNGSDEIIQLLLMALPVGSCVLSPSPGFVMYQQIALSLELPYVGVPLLADNFDLDLPAMLAAIKQHQPKLIFLAYPNNPTGNLFSEDAILQILAAAPGMVVVDEAYAPFANASFMPHLLKYPQLLVMRTLSKLGLAGLRLGYMAGDNDIIEQLNKIRLPYNINCLTQLSAQFALSNTLLFAEQTQRICAERERLMLALNALPGMMAYPSAANFILLRTPAGKAELIFSYLKQHGILIKNLSAQGGLLSDCLRVTIGTEQENSLFLNALTDGVATIC